MREGDDKNVRITITAIASVVAVATAVIVPLLYFYTAYVYESARLRDTAHLAAEQLSKRYYLFPDVWKFEVETQSRTMRVVERSSYPISYRVLDEKGELVFEDGERSGFISLTHKEDISDGVTTGGTVVISESLWPVIRRTSLAGLVGLVLAFGTFVALRTLPLRALGRAQHDLRELNEQLEQRVEERTAALAKAQSELVRKERLAAVGQLTATVSHELRNPLGAIRSASDALKKLLSDKQTAQISRAMGLLERSQVRCDRVISELLDFTRVRELDLIKTQVDDWLGLLLDDYEVPTEVTLWRKLESDVRTELDPYRLDRVLRNIIDNACHAVARNTGSAPEAGEARVTVASRRTGDRLELVVSDNGSGIDPDDLPKIFEPLFSTKSFGVGLGLPMVKQVAEQHGGGVEIESEPGAGTEVVFWIPLRDKDADQPERAAGPQEAELEAGNRQVSKSPAAASTIKVVKAGT